MRGFPAPQNARSDKLILTKYIIINNWACGVVDILRGFGEPLFISRKKKALHPQKERVNQGSKLPRDEGSNPSRLVPVGGRVDYFLAI